MNLLLPSDVRALLKRRYANQHMTWLEGGGSWPLTFSLGAPTDKEVVNDAATVRAWVAAWNNWDQGGEVGWVERKWARMGTQRLPATLSFADADVVAVEVGEGARWRVAVKRRALLLARWPKLAPARYFDMFAGYSDADFERLQTLIAWHTTNPVSNLYLRQLPIEGLDTKWVEQRKGLVTDLMRCLRGMPDADFFDVCGLRRTPHRLRVRVLCPQLRAHFGGLCDIEAPMEELRTLTVKPGAVVIVENLATGMALPDIPGAVAFMKIGNAVSVLNELAWIQGVPTVYWGDIDTYGFAILERARRVLPNLRSVLMDEETLLSYRPLWGIEDKQHPDVPLPLLTAAERLLYLGLRENKWAPQLRLEQERLSWGKSVAAVVEALQ